MVLCLVLAARLMAAPAEAQAPAPAPSPVPESAPKPASAAQRPEGDYVVKKGDTLWGIAKDLLNDPFLWPRIWDRNPFITNPNLIFPGDTLALPGKEVVPAPAPVAEAPKPEPPKEAPKEVAKAPAPTPPPTPEMELAPPPPVPVASRAAIACSPVLLDEQAVAEAGIGTVAKSIDNRHLLSQEDHIVVAVDGAQTLKVGDRLAVVRPGLRVIHPSRKGTLGRALFTLGLFEVTQVQARTASGRLIYSCLPMNIGDRVMPFALPPFPEDKIAQPTTRVLEGVIVDTPLALQLLGLQNLVWLDVGTSQGIGPGDVFAVYRPHVPTVNLATGEVVPIPADRLGEAVVTRVTNTTATAVISASVREIRAGDQVVLSRQIQP
jgi:LysM repeat protein